MPLAGVAKKPRFAPFGKTHQSPLQFLFSIFGMGRKNKRAKSASKAREGKELKKIKTEEMEKWTSMAARCTRLSPPLTAAVGRSFG